MVPPSPDAQRFLPSLERARAEGVVAKGKLWFLPIATDLMSRTPAEEHAVAAVVLRARVERRHVEERATQLPKGVVETLPSTPDPPPKGFATRRHRYLVEREPVWSDCEMCEVEPGEMPCGVCTGTGKIASIDGEGAQITRRCPHCDGGFVTCATCDGEGHAVRCTIAEVDDHEASLHYTYVPSMTLALEMAVGELLDPQARPPECLQVGFDVKTARSAYRGATKQVDATLMGHDYNVPLDSARAAVRGLGLPGDFVGHDIQIYAWPILWLRYRGLGGRHDVALVVDGDGRLRAFTS